MPMRSKHNSFCLRISRNSSSHRCLKCFFCFQNWSLLQWVEPSGYSSRFKSLHLHPDLSTFKMPGNSSQLLYAGLPVYAWGCGNSPAINASCFSDKTSVGYTLGSGIHLLLRNNLRLPLPKKSCQRNYYEKTSHRNTLLFLGLEYVLGISQSASPFFILHRRWRRTSWWLTSSLYL